MIKKNSFLLFVAIFLLTGCGKIKDVNGSKSFVNTEPPAETSSSSESNVQKVIYSLVTGRLGIQNQYYSPSPSGAYSILQRPDGTANLLYLDEKTKTQVYLSNETSPEYNNENDTSWIDNTGGGCSAFVAGSKLYVLNFGANTSKQGKQQFPGITQMELDGRNKKRLTEWESHEWPKGAIAFDGSNIYIMVDSFEQNTSTTNLYSINTHSQAKSNLLPLGNEGKWFILGTFEDGLIVKELKGSTNGLIHTLYKYDVSNNNLEVIRKWADDELSEICYNNEVYFIEKVSNRLFKLDITTNTEYTLNEAIASEEYHCKFDYKVYDEHLLINQQSVFDSNLYFFDLRTSQYGPVILKGFQDSSLRIVAEYENSFLVMLSPKTVKIQDFTPDGIPQITDYQIFEVGFIAKNDYWNGVPKYEYITDTVFTK